MAVTVTNERRSPLTVWLIRVVGLIGVTQFSGLQRALMARNNLAQTPRTLPNKKD